MTGLAIQALQLGVLALLYLFVARVVGVVMRDLRPTARRGATADRPRTAPAGQPAAAPAAPPSPAPAAGRRGARAGRPPGELVVHEPTGRPRRVRLDGSADEVTLGRGQETTVQLRDDYVSDRHTRVHRDGTRWVVTDLGSTNGTYLNRERVSRPTPITAGDQLRLGKTTVEVRA